MPATRTQGCVRSLMRALLLGPFLDSDNLVDLLLQGRKLRECSFCPTTIVMRHALHSTFQSNRRIRRGHVGDHARAFLRAGRVSIWQREVIDFLELRYERAKIILTDLAGGIAGGFGEALTIESDSAVAFDRQLVNWTGAEAGPALKRNLIAAGVLVRTLAHEDRFRNHRVHAFVAVDELRDVEIGRDAR